MEFVSHESAQTMLMILSYWIEIDAIGHISVKFALAELRMLSYSASHRRPHAEGGVKAQHFKMMLQDR